MQRVYFIVGQTAVGKSDIAVEVARQCAGEIVSADAFQIYAGLNLLTAKPEEGLLRLAPHHLVGVVPLREAMNAEEFRRRALAAIAQIHERGKVAFVVGGSGLYVKALTHGLSPLPPASAELRLRLEQLSEGELLVRLSRLDPAAAGSIDAQNKRRLLRAVEICLLTGEPVSAQRTQVPPATEASGVFLLRDRAELYERINQRVQMMFANGVVDEVRLAGELGPTAANTLGLREIRELIAGRISVAQCIAAIQQATRRYAKRQLTWFQHQTNFEPLNLSRIGASQAVEWIARQARLSLPQQDD